MIIFSMNVTFAAKKIIYIPIDNRPCNLKQVVEVGEKLDYEIVTPPEELLGRDSERLGEPDKLWRWLDENSFGATAAVISTDAMFLCMIYLRERLWIAPKISRIIIKISRTCQFIFSEQL